MGHHQKMPQMETAQSQAVVAVRTGRAPALAWGGELPSGDDLPRTLPAALRQAALPARAGDLVYVQEDGQETRQSYAELLIAAERVLSGLRTAGLNAGDQALLQLERNEDLLAAFWGCLLGGIVPVVSPVPPTYAQANRFLDQLVYLYGVLDHPTVITVQSLRPHLASLGDSSPMGKLRLVALEELRECAPDPDHWACADEDPAFFSLTSGSTSRPKCVVLTHRNVLSRARGANQLGRHGADDVVLSWLPFDHIGSISDWHLRCVLLGCRAVYVPTRYVLAEPLRWLDLLQTYRVTHSWAPNFAYHLLNDSLAKAEPRRWDLSCVSGLVTAGEAVSPQVLRRFTELLASSALRRSALRPAFGMAEMASGVTYYLGDDADPVRIRRVKRASLAGELQSAVEDDADAVSFVSLGPPIPGVHLQIVDADRSPLPEETVGQLQVRGQPVSKGYYRAPEANHVFHDDGWFETGDLGFLSRGELYLTGRAKETVIVNGVNYGCGEIEELVDAEEEVARSFSVACAVRSPGSEQEQLAVFFHTAHAAPRELATLFKRIRGNLARNLGIQPDYLVPLPKESIPKTAVGKLQRGLLRARFESGEFAPLIRQYELLDGYEEPSSHPPRSASSASDDGITRRLTEIWKEVLGLTQVGQRDNVFELGGNSLLLVRLHSRIEAAFGPRLSLVDMFQYPTIEAQSRLLATPQDSNPVPLPAVRGRQRAAARRRSQLASGTADIAVIGLACRFPGSANAQEFWNQLTAGEESISRLSEQQVLAAGVDPQLVRDPHYVRAAPLLDGIEQFDADFFGYSAREAERMDPQQRVLLECAWEAMEDAGYDLRHYPGAVGVFVSGVLNTYLLNNLYPSGAHLDQDASRVMTLSSTGGFQVMVANDKDYLPTRISYKLHLRGPSLNIQTACSSSLVAIHVAAQSLLAGECEMALAGGVSISVPQETGYLYQDGLLVSPDGHCRPFDADAQGTIFGNGAGLVLLKKLESAVADGDQVYAVIKGSAVNNDGGQKAGYLAPSQEGQAAVVAEALAAAGINAESISYVEAHGTATALGDPIEIAGLTQAFRADTAREQFCAVGSVKSNIGHLQIASGVAGFIKTALALRHRQLVPSLHFRSPNPRIDFARSPFYVNTRLQDWPAASNPRRASVNSLGIGGTNVHVILEEPPESLPPVRTVDRPRHVLALSGKNRQALRDLAGRWAATADTGGELDLGDACFTANAGRAHLSERIALVVEGWAPLRDKLQQFLAGETLPADVALGCASEAPPQIVFLFSGQNSQHPIAERDLYATSPAFRSAIDECQQALRPLLAEVPSDVLHADAAGGQGPNQPIWTQPRLFALQYALARLWMSWGITPSAVLGHEVGQYVAACIAGVLRLEDALKLVVHQQRLMEGTREPIADAVEAFRQFASELDYSLPHIPIISPFDGSAVPDEVARVDYWCRHVCQPVSLGQTIAAATNRTCDVYLELGPEPTLLPLLRERLEESGRAGEFTLAASLCGDRSPWDTMLQSLAALYVRGVSVDWAGFDRDYVRRRRSVPTYPFQRQRYWVDRPAASLERGGQRASEEQDRRRLLGRRLISTALKDAVFETRIGLESLPILNDHRFCDVPLLPGAFQLAMFFEATQRLGIPASCEMEGVSFTKALTGSSGPEKIAQVIVSSDEGSQRTLQLVAQPVNAEEDDEWTVHSQARLAPVPAATPRLPIEIEPLRQRLLTQARRVVSREEFYAAMRDHRAQLGPRFQAIETAWVGQGEVLCQLRFPEDLKQGDPHWGHMVLLDACVQVLGGAESYSLQHTLVPTAVERFWFLRPPRGERLWCYLRDLSSESGSTEQRIADVWLCEEDGEVIAAFTGLRLDAIPHEVLLNALGEEEVDWVYRQVWSPAPRPASTNARELSGSWLIFADQGGLGTRLSQLIVDQGGRSTIVRPGDRWLRDESAAYHLDPGDPQHFVRLLETAWGTASSSPRGVVYLWGLDQDADPLRLVDSGSSCASATYLLQALAKSGSTHGMDFFLVTRGTQAVDGHSGPTGIGQAPLWGLSRTAGIEYPEMRSVRIDIDAVVGDEPLALLLAELCETGPERDVVLRGSDRYVRRLERQSLSAVSPISIRPDVTYLITGGTGGVGMQLATSLVQQGARHLVLVSRRGPSSSEAQRIAAQWAERGVQAFIWGADVAVEAELHAVLQRIRTELAPLRGVIHAAGVLADGMLQELDWEAFAGVMRAKVVGTWNLHRLTEDQSLDFFVACSSIASLMGSPGQANYSAANAFLDVLMQHRRASGLPGLVVNWGPWNDVGMVTALGDAGRRALARRGLMPLDTAAVLRSFPSLLGSGTAQLVAARIDWQQYLQEGAGTANAAWVQELVRRNAEPADGQGAFRKHLEQAPHADRHRLLLEYVRDLVSGLLGLPAATPIEVETGFHELGLDSLGVLTLRNRLQSSLGLTLPATVGYRFSTIQSLVEYLAETLGLRSPTAFTPPSDDKEEHPEAAPGAELDGLSLPELADRLAEKLAAIRSGYGGT